MKFGAVLKLALSAGLSIGMACLSAAVVCPFLCGCQADWGKLDQLRWRWGDKPLVDAWVAGEMVALTDRTAKFTDESVYNPVRRSVQLQAGANETVSFQLVVDAGDQPLESLKVQWTALVGADKQPLPQTAISAFRAWPVRIDKYPPWYLRLVDSVPQPADYYDALIPLTAPKNAMPLFLPKGGRLVLWFDLAVPRTATAGAYDGRLTCSASGRSDWSVAVHLEVQDFVLPDAMPLAVVGGFDHAELWSQFMPGGAAASGVIDLAGRDPQVRKGLAVMRKLMVLAREHRIDLFDSRISPAVKRDLAGKVQIDWTDYDAVVGPYLDGSALPDRIGVAAWPMPLSERFPDPQQYGGLDSDDYAAAFSELLAECSRHFSTAAGGDSAGGAAPEPNEPTTQPAAGASGQLFLWPFRGAVDSGGYEQFARMARLARSSGDKTPILCQLPVAPPAMSGWRPAKDMTDLVDISAPPAQWFDPALTMTWAGRQSGSQLAGVWLSPGQVPYLPSLGLLASPADVRAMPWFAVKYRCAGLFLGDVLHWSGDPADRSGNAFWPEASSETRLFYPGTIAGLEEPLPSVRLKRLRRGLQDVLYLWILRQRGQEKIAQDVVGAMVRYAGLAAAGDNYLDVRLDGWVQDAGAWRQARELLSVEVLRAVHPSSVQATSQPTLRERLAWNGFEDRTHKVRVEQVRCRVLPVRDAAGRVGEPDQLEMTVLVDLFNEYSRGVNVSLSVSVLPEGWKSPPAAQVAFPAAGRGTAELKIRGVGASVGPDGHLPLKLALAAEAARQDEIVADVPFLLAGQAARSPKIDGVLDDWPLRQGDCAGSFRLVGRRGRPADYGADQKGAGLAKRRTLAFVMRDRDNLYIAFRCQEPDLPGMVAKAGNVVNYEQLMLVGEDLVEVILDPGATARSVEDLYHIVVKSNGVLIAERGVQTDLPLGKSSVWPVGAVVAVGRQADAWVVEMSIPLSAFGEEARSSLWGVNFARYATAGAEASSWSGAPRYFYDSRNLGTMFVPSAAAK